ncbi:MAG: glycosyl hydrolase, partial [Candidatus Aminicenantes bacterium]|nr:glycosyl hydrolase [Candidatus Aminicenantes bacterium]
MRLKISKILVLLICFLFLLVSNNFVFSEDQGLFNEEILKFFKYREMGPARQGGRILVIASPPDKPYTFYVSTATGGLWKTENNGTTFTSLFQDCGSIAIGAFAIAPLNPDILWVGTGTAASGRISLLGDGIYRSTDAGKTWQHMGLEKTIHIGKIAVNPNNPDIVYAAALGYHFSFNPERGLYKTTDGGKTWMKSLFI